MNADKNLYLVDEGDVTLLATPCHGTDVIEEITRMDLGDGTTRVIALAESEDEALKLSGMYDDGLIAPDNVAYNGVTVGALFLQSEQ